MNLTHRGYGIIMNEKRRYVARSTDGDGLVISSFYRPRVLDAIDSFWNALDHLSKEKP